MSLTHTPVPSTVKKLRVATSSENPLASTSVIRGHRFQLDQPTAAGGSDSAPSPMEALLGSVLGCTQVVTTRTAEELGLKIGAQHAYVVAPQDSRGQTGVTGIQPYFTDATIYLAVETIANDTSTQRLRLLAQSVEERCPGLNLIADAQVRVTVHWGFAEQSSPESAEFFLHELSGLQPRVEEPAASHHPHTLFTTDGTGNFR